MNEAPNCKSCLVNFWEASWTKQTFETCELAKAAAQADHNVRILSALDPDALAEIEKLRGK